MQHVSTVLPADRQLPQPSAELSNSDVVFEEWEFKQVKFFFAAIAAMWGDKKFHLNWPPNEAYTDDAGNDFPENMQLKAAQREWGKEICEHTEAQLREGLQHIKKSKNPKYQYIDLRDILDAVKDAKKPAYHKPFGPGLPHLALPNETNKAEMAKLRESLAI